MDSEFWSGSEVGSLLWLFIAKVILASMPAFALSKVLIQEQACFQSQVDGFILAEPQTTSISFFHGNDLATLLAIINISYFSQSASGAQKTDGFFPNASKKSPRAAAQRNRR